MLHSAFRIDFVVGIRSSFINIFFSDKTIGCESSEDELISEDSCNGDTNDSVEIPLDEETIVLDGEWVTYIFYHCYRPTDLS